MKKYFNLGFISFLSFVLILSLFSFVKTVDAKNDCKPGQVYDTETGTPCASIATCVGETVNHITGKPCSGISSGANNSVSGSVAFTNFIVNSMDSMKYGNKNELDVAILQSVLNGLGFLNVQPTGNFLSQTGVAVGKLQKNLGLKSDRVVGLKTKEAIKTIIARNPTLAEKIAKLVSGVPVKEIAKKKAAEDTKSKGPAVSSITSCPASKLAGASVNGVATVTARSYFKLFKVTKDSKLSLITEDIGNTDGGEIPERRNFTLDKDEKLLIVEITDKDFSENAVLGEFTYEGKSFVTNAGDWSSSVTSIDSPSGLLKQISVSLLEEELKKVKWGTPYELYNNSTDPRIRAIGYKANWISAYINGEVPEKENSKVVFYMTKGSGVSALKYCGEVSKAICPYPEEGTGDFDCKWPAVIPADPSPHRCGPSYLTEINTNCNIASDDSIEVNAEVVFAPGRAAVTPYPYGVELVIFPSDGSAPEVHLQHFVPTPYPTEFSESHIKFFYKSIPGQPKPTINKFNGKVVPQGHGGFKRNGIFETDAMTKWAILQPSIKCETPDPATLDIDVIKECGDGTIDLYVKFSSAVKVTGVPVVEVIKNDGTKGISLNYVSGSNTDTLKFRYNVTSNFTEGDVIGDFVFSLPLNNATINTVSGNNPVVLTGAWTAPDSPFCPAPVTPEISVTEVCRGNMTFIPIPGQEITASVKFNEPVLVTGVPTLKIITSDGAPGVVLPYLSGSGSTKLVFRYITPDPVPSGFNYTKSSFMGDYMFNLPFNNAFIKTLVGQKPVILTGEWTAPNGDNCPTP